jgi:hypothetical protein
MSATQTTMRKIHWNVIALERLENQRHQIVSAKKDSVDVFMEIEFSES